MQRLPVRHDAPAKGTQAPRKPAISNRRKALALILAMGSDAISLFTLGGTVLPVEWFVDGMTALLLFALLGFHWQMLPAFVAEVIPGIALFPTWTAVVIWIASDPRSK